MHAIDVLTYGHAMILDTVERYEPDDWSLLALGTWTAKDLLGHLGAFEVRFADVLATFVGAEATSGLMDADPSTFNDEQAAVRVGWTVQAVLDEYLTAHEQAMGHARALDPARWQEVGTIPWYGPGYSLDDLVVYTMYGHKREHDPQLSAALERRAGGG